MFKYSQYVSSAYLQCVINNTSQNMAHI